MGTGIAGRFIEARLYICIVHTFKVPLKAHIHTSFSRHCGGCLPDHQTPRLASYLRYWQYIEQVSLECCADNTPPSFSPFTPSASPSLPPPSFLSPFFLRHLFSLLPLPPPSLPSSSLPPPTSPSQPQFESHLRSLARATINTKRNSDVYRNVLMYRPPGTEKPCLPR